jgi:hypothetical protein
MTWQKFLKLINWPTPAEQHPLPEDFKPSTPPPKINIPREDGADEATRPLYRIGKRKPSDFQKAIDMSG